ncbi:MAG: hypothetical protein WC450_10455 [Candidatus Omnitrophota bacterium]|jgi:hypothetical protein
MAKVFIHLRLLLQSRKAFFVFIVLSIVFQAPMNSFANELWTIEEALSPVAVYDPVEKKVVVSKLQYQVASDASSECPMLVTVHSGVSSIVRIYLLDVRQLRLLKSFRAAYSAMEKPVFFSLTLSGESRPVQLLHISEQSDGNAAYTTEHVYDLCPPGYPLLKEVKVISPADTYRSQLKDGEDIRTGVRSRFSKEGLYFEFYIWNKDDANCCPSAGKVNGTYKLVRDENNEGDLTIVAHEFHRGDILPYDYKTLY